MTSAIYLSRFGYKVLVFSGYSYGSLEQTSLIENFPGFPEGISGTELLKNIKTQAERFGATFFEEEVLKIVPECNLIETDLGNKYEYDALIVATGSTPYKLSVPGEFNYCAMCDGLLFKGKKVLVIGGGDTALTEAIHLSGICTEVTILYRRKIKASKILKDRCESFKNVFFQQGELECFNDGAAVIATANSKQFVKEVDGVFVSIGNVPNDYLVKDAFGSIQDRVKNVFMCGDCKRNLYRQAIVAAGDGAKTAIEVDGYFKFQSQFER